MHSQNRCLDYVSSAEEPTIRVLCISFLGIFITLPVLTFYFRTKLFSKSMEKTKE